MSESFWQKDKMVTHICFDLCLFNHFRPVANFGNQSILVHFSASVPDLCTIVYYFTLFKLLTTLQVFVEPNGRDESLQRRKKKEIHHSFDIVSAIFSKRVQPLKGQELSRPCLSLATEQRSRREEKKAQRQYEMSQKPFKCDSEG